MHTDLRPSSIFRLARPGSIGSLLALLLVVALVAGPRSATVAEAAPPQNARVSMTGCTSTSAQASFTWEAAPGATVYWLDLSAVDNGFQPGTFVGNGPLDARATSLIWEGLQPGAIYFWRVNALTPSGWAASPDGTFVACGNPTLRNSTVRCDADGTATVQFRWAPSTTPSLGQWLDLSIYDNGFAPGSFVSAGPLPATTGSLTWSGILTDTQQYFRINSLTQTGWQATATGTIFPCPAATREPGAPPPIPGPEMEGERWVLIDLAKQEATAMIGDSPLYTVLVTTGKPGWETPKGTYSIIYRVEDETMTSESIGAEEYYVLDHVLYTQYFTTEGHALHLNYWRPDYYFGEIESSHGCVGMRLDAAEFFWRFADYGTRVTII